MPDAHIGIDFGTSNSAVGCSTGKSTRLLNLEPGHTTIPSAIFYDFSSGQPIFGHKAMAAYTRQDDGRLLRALKSVLGSSLIEESTLVRNRRIAFAEIIGHFIGHLKTTAEQQLKQNIDSIVLGRPVQFVDGDEVADAMAQTQLERIARGAGFKHISFQYEPVAAALAYEQHVKKEELALVADIGGGTSDFSIVRVSPARHQQTDRRADVLANTGVHIGGTDLDKRLSLYAIMPHLGYKTFLKDKPTIELPASSYFDLASWHRIALLYERKELQGLRELRMLAAQPELIERMIHVVENHEGYHLAGDAEAAKVTLSGASQTEIDLAYVEAGLKTKATRAGFERAMRGDGDKLTECIKACLKLAGIAAAQINTVFLTGGSTFVPAIYKACTAPFAGAQIVEGDKLGSVATGLAIDAARRFGVQQ